VNGTILFIGWAGFAVYLLAYALLAAGLLRRGRPYFALNVAAALAVTAVSVFKGSVQAALINLAWAVLSAAAFVNARPRAVASGRAVLRGLIALGLACAAALGLAGRWAGAVEALSWTSVAAFVGGYLLFSTHAVGRLEFHLLNVIASTSLLPGLWQDANWPVFALETAWGSIAAVGAVSEEIGEPVEL